MFHTSLYFTQQADWLTGWSSNWWNNATDVTTALDRARRLYNKAVLLTGSGVIWPGYEVRGDPGKRISEIRLNPNANENAATVGTDADADNPQASLLMKVYGAGGYKISEWFAGVPDAVTSRGGHYIPTPAFTPNVNAFRNFLTNVANGYVLNVADQANLWKPVDAATPAGAITVKGHGFADNDKVRVSRAQGLTQINGLWRINVIDANTFQLMNYSTPATPLPLFGKPRCRKIAMIQVAITDLKITKASKHNRGRPFGERTGRRLRRAR